jgi:hypothetical protein
MGPTYIPVQADVGNTLRVIVVASNSFGASDPAASGTSGVVQPAVPPSNSLQPFVDGLGLASPKVGAELTANPGQWAGTQPITFMYQWYRCAANGANCLAIAGAATKTYTPVVQDVGSTLRVAVTAKNAAAPGGVGPIFSLQTAAVVQPPGPVNLTLPTVSGSEPPTVGATLTANAGTWEGTPPIVYSYRWQRCNADGEDCVDIANATGPTYQVVQADADFRLRVVVTAANAEGDNAKASSPTGVVAPAAGPVNTTKPSISGTASVGQTLTANAGSWESATPVVFSYRWQRCNARGEACQDIPGATEQTYRLVSADRGSRIVVVVTATNAQGNMTATSNPTAVVKGVPAGQTIPVSQVSLPNRLVISDSVFDPEVLRSRAPFTARFRVMDSQGHFVSGADVYLVAIPYGRVLPPGTRRTDQSGWASFTIQPTRKFPLTKGYLITFFVRATKPGGDLLGGVSTRRLVSVRINPR